MSLQPYILTEPQTLQVPLIVDSPHSGRIYPADFAYSCPHHMLRQTEDSYVGELIAGATQAGAVALTAEFPRSYIDVNRAEDDLDPAVLAEVWPIPLNPSDRTLQGLGLVRRLCRSNIPVYAAPLTADEVQQRIAKFYRPYHAALAATVQKITDHFGESYLINTHSMPSQSHENRGLTRPDFILGDRDGTSCDLSFTRTAQNILLDMGYSVALNDPYKGMEITKRYGNPRLGQHALQLEINRRLYINEQTLEKTEGFSKLRTSLNQFFQILANDIIDAMPDRMAAE